MRKGEKNHLPSTLIPQMAAMAETEPIHCQELRASSGSPLQAQDPKAWGHPLLQPQTTNRGLDLKWSSRTLKRIQPLASALGILLSVIIHNYATRKPLVTKTSAVKNVCWCPGEWVLDEQRALGCCQVLAKFSWFQTSIHILFFTS